MESLYSFPCTIKKASKFILRETFLARILMSACGIAPYSAAIEQYLGEHYCSCSKLFFLYFP